jgi:hypothetical protein
LLPPLNQNVLKPLCRQRWTLTGFAGVFVGTLLFSMVPTVLAG